LDFGHSGSTLWTGVGRGERITAQVAGDSVEGLGMGSIRGAVVRTLLTGAILATAVPGLVVLTTRPPAAKTITLQVANERPTEAAVVADADNPMMVPR
jgi:hypothetical protein